METNIYNIGVDRLFKSCYTASMMRFNIAYIKLDGLAGSTQRDFASYDEAQAWLFERVEETHCSGRYEAAIIVAVISETSGPGYKTYQFNPINGNLIAA